MKKVQKTVLLVVSLLALVASGASAATIGLDVLVGGGTITINNFLFSEFSYSSAGNFALPAAQISVTDSIVGSNPTLSFQAAWAAAGSGTNTPGSTDSLIGYKITAVTPPPISDLHLTLTAGAVVGNAFISVLDTYTTGAKSPGGTFVEDLLVYKTTSATQLTDSVILNQTYSELYVVKDIGLSAFGAGSLAFASAVDQGISSVPEPGTLLLLGSGLLGLALAGAREKSRK